MPAAASSGENQAEILTETGTRTSEDVAATMQLEDSSIHSGFTEELYTTTSGRARLSADCLGITGLSRIIQDVDEQEIDGPRGMSIV